MILTTTPLNFEEIVDPAISVFHGGDYWPANGSIRQVINNVVQVAPTSAISINSGDELVLRVTEYGTRDGEELTQEEMDVEKTKIGWALWIEGDDEYIIINNKDLADEAINDFTVETDKVLYLNNLKTYAYTEASQGIEDFSTTETPDDRNQLSIKLSKWFDGKTVFIEAFRNSPNRGTRANSPLMDIAVTAAIPEITKVYWEESIDADVSQVVSTVGFNQTIDLCIESLGISNQDFQLEIIENNNNFYPAWDDTVFETRTVTVSSRKTYIEVDIPSLQDCITNLSLPNNWTEEFRLDALISQVPIIPQTPVIINNPVAVLTVTESEGVTNAYFARRIEQTNDLYTFEKIEKANLLDEVYLVAECTNLDGETIDFQVFNDLGETTFAELEDNDTTPLSLLAIDEEGNSTEDTIFLGAVNNGLAYAKVKFKDRENAATWNDILFTTTAPATVMDFVDAKLFIIATSSTSSLPERVDYSSQNNLFTLRAAVVVYNIYHTNARITKTNVKEPIKAKYIYHDSNTPVGVHSHNDMICDVLKIESRNNGVRLANGYNIPSDFIVGETVTPTQGGECKNIYHFGQNRNYMAISTAGATRTASARKRRYSRSTPLSYVFMIKMPNRNVPWANPGNITPANPTLQGLDYEVTINGLTTNLRYTFWDTSRRYCNPDFFAGFIGVLGDLNYNDIECTGSCFIDGTGHPSLEHSNGLAMDTRYLGNNITRGVINQFTQQRRGAFDLAREQNLINAFKKFYFTKRIKGSLGTYNNLQNSTHNNGGHNDHLHCGKMDYRGVEMIID